MDELNLTIQSRTPEGRFSKARTATHRLVLFNRPERHALATPQEPGPIGALQLCFAKGEQFVLHSLVLRRGDGADLFRWAGAGELFRESRGLRLARADSGVVIECVGDDPRICMTLDPENSGEALQVLLTVSSTGALTEPSERTPDRVALAIELLHRKIEATDEKIAETRERLTHTSERMAAAHAQAAREAGERLAQLRAELARQAEVAESRHVEIIRTFDIVRAEAEQRQHALVDVINVRVGEHLQRQEAQLAQARDLIAAQAGRLGALERSTSWRITAPLRFVTSLLTGRRSLSAIARRLKARRQPARPTFTDVPAEAPSSAPERPAPRPVAFPMPGALATLAELTEGPRPALPLRVSVIIPTYNASEEFYWLLRKLLGQQGLAGVEVVVVDSGSNDGTPELAEQFGCKVVRITQAEFSHSHARNLGADNASGDLYVFTVQDAYPVGDWWLYSLARALTEPGPDGVQLAAVSCSEFPRTDSELLYNAAVDTHYRFLGCRDGDRVGRHTGDDHMALRTQGQLSDVACMIPAATFHKYRYQGRYAEDLILGVRLIKDGLPVAMLSSVKVIHSHNRPAAYHLKRTFVDVVFLTEVFPDFPIPMAESAGGAAVAAALLDHLVEGWRPQPGVNAAAQLREFAGRVRSASVTGAPLAPVDFGFAPLRPWLEKAVGEGGGGVEADAVQLRNMYADRLEHLAQFVDQTYGEADEHLAEALAATARKTLAATFGAQLSFLYLRQANAGPKARRARVEELRTLMTAGI